MSTPAKALGSRENWWGERSLEELLEADPSELDVSELRTVIEHEVDFNLDLESMAERELRTYLRDLRANDGLAMEAFSNYERARWKAHTELRKRADKLSATAKFAPPCRPGGFIQVGFAWLEAGIDPHTYEPLDSDALLDHDPLAVHSERMEVDLTDPCLHIPRETSEQWGTTEYGQFRFRRRYDPENGYIGGVAFHDLEMSEFMQLAEDIIADLDSRHCFSEEQVSGWVAGARSMKKESGKSDEDILTQILYQIFLNADN